MSFLGSYRDRAAGLDGGFVTLPDVQDRAGRISVRWQATRLLVERRENLAGPGPGTTGQAQWACAPTVAAGPPRGDGSAGAGYGPRSSARSIDPPPRAHEHEAWSSREF